MTFVIHFVSKTSAVGIISLPIIPIICISFTHWMILMSLAASSTSLTSAASPTSEAALTSSAWFHQKCLKSNYLASKWPALVQLLGMKPQKKPCFREFREHFYWRLWRPASAFKIYSKGVRSNGGVLWICHFLIFLSTYWFSDIFSPFKKLLLRWVTL